MNARSFAYPGSDTYRPGGAWAICDVCSQRVRRTDLFVRWDNLRVDIKCLDPRPPQMSIPNVYPEGIPFPDARSPQDRPDRLTDDTALQSVVGGMAVQPGLTYPSSTMQATNAPLGVFASNLILATVKMTNFDANLNGMEGIAYDGTRYVYVTPHANNVIAKVDTTTFTVVASLNINTLIPHPSAPAFFGSFIGSDNHLYLIPHSTSGVAYNYIVRVDLANFTATGVSYMDYTASGTVVPSTWAGVGGYATDGTYGYMAGATVSGPTSTIALIRFGLGNNFTSAGVHALDLATVVTNGGGLGPTFWDGTYIWSGALYFPTPGVPPKNTYYFRVSPSNFTPAGVKFGQLGTSHDRTYVAFDDGQNLWSGPNIQLDNVTPVPIYRFNKQTLSVTDAWDGSAISTTINTWALSGANPFDGRFGYIVSNAENTTMIVDTQYPGRFLKSPMGGNTGYQPGALIAGSYGYLSPFSGVVGVPGLLGRFNLEPNVAPTPGPLPPPGPNNQPGALSPLPIYESIAANPIEPEPGNPGIGKPVGPNVLADDVTFITGPVSAPDNTNSTTPDPIE